ncbi:hypothetical protein PFISCL1PPCAC_8937 [Pristionchus fissidentatus]|uniref:Uncharacterized protein n=1 Tax=Pristionchus fissidentatus TaxID=1538716 RepID=A0AAV5VI80_9BILA|nr:hypothetical protein PFISCL1PPCAC_8937 [Pristionchus fissidentatus]
MGKTTHISNNSIHGIWVMVDADREHISRVSANFNTTMGKFASGGGIDIRSEMIHVANSIGFTKIMPGDYLPFHPAGRDGTVYISIYWQENMTGIGPLGPLETVCVAWPRQRDHSATVRDSICDGVHIPVVHPVRHGEIW